MLTALLFGAISAISLPLGTWLTYRTRVNEVRLGIIAGFGAGTLVGAAALELLPAAERNTGILPVVGGLLAGAVLFTVLDTLASRWLNRWNTLREAHIALALFIGAMIDGLPEALALGIDIFTGLGTFLPLLAAIFLSNLPESMVGSGALRAAGYRLKTALLLWSAAALAITLMTGAGYLLAGMVGPTTKGILLALAAGGIVAVTADTLIPTAARLGNHRAGLAAALGLAVILLLQRA